MNKRGVLVVVVSVVLSSWFEVASANLIQNHSFEQVPCTTPCNNDQGFLPSNWLILKQTPDTYSNDGSYGLAPSGFGNFTGATAQDGIRWVAGWSFADEIFGQSLADPLTTGVEYTLSAFLRKAVRPDLAHPGTYQIELWDSTNVDTSSKLILGSFDPIDNQDDWELRTLQFTAPAAADSHSVLAFRPLHTTTAGFAYPGVDNVLLEATPTSAGVPEPSSLLLLGLGLAGFIGGRRLRGRMS